MLLFAPASYAEKPHIRIDYPTYWPFFIRDESGRMQGFFYEIVTEGLARTGINAEWRTFPWARCQDHVKNGEADGMVTVPTPERLAYTKTHSTPFYRKKLSVFTYAGNPKMSQIQSIKDIDDIVKANLSVVTYSGNGWNDRHIRTRGIKTHETPNLVNVWSMLANRRGDIVIEWPVAAWPDIKKAGVSKDIIFTNAVLDCMPFHLLIRKDSPYADILPDFDKKIIEMQQDGTIDRIMSKYIEEFFERTR
ncbi:substrate-binding periplasmic protein [Pseudodesulfovibrio cashew]|nr:transporter substrate-binding domain-containing protein [Pseudodesulfovibrio cashew]